MSYLRVCVVLVAAGNVGSFVHNRTHTGSDLGHAKAGGLGTGFLPEPICDITNKQYKWDFEGSVKDFYGVPVSHTIHASHIDRDTKDSIEETEEENAPGRDFEKSFRDFYGPPLLFNSDHRASHMPLVTENTDVDISQDDLDIKALRNIWGVSSAPPAGQDDETTNKFGGDDDAPNAETLSLATEIKNIFGSPEVVSESMISTGNYSANNETGMTFENEDRFLSETLLKTNWLRNAEEEDKTVTTKTPRHSRKPLDNLEPQPNQHSTSNREHSSHLPEQRRNSLTEHILVPSSGNALVSKSLVLMTACLSLISYH